MDEKDFIGIVPRQEEGVVINAENSVTFDNPEGAKKMFETAKQRLLDVNQWQALAGKLLADFQLTDASGREVNGPVQEGWYFRIDIPGPGSNAGEGYDWARVEAVRGYQEGEVESLGIRVRPAPNPTGRGGETAHFYAETATSSFIVSREGNRVTAAIYDRNTQPNTDAQTAGDQMRNVLAGVAGMISFSKLQWRRLAEGLLAQGEK
jgi:hypothetical protein